VYDRSCWIVKNDRQLLARRPEGYPADPSAAPSKGGFSGRRRNLIVVIALTRSDTFALADLDACVNAVRAAFHAYGSGRSLGLARVHVDGLGGGVFHLTAGGLGRGGDGTVGIKLNGRFPPASGTGPQRVAGAILLSDAGTGTPIALLDSMVVTGLRTAAVTVVVAERLARSGSSSALLVGAGRQARGQVDALRRVGISRLAIADLLPAQAEATAEYARRGGLDAEAVDDAHAAARESDVVVTITPARAPILGAGNIAPGTLVVALGADGPGKQELEPALLARARVVVDVLDQAATSGELQHALASETLTVEDVHAELGDTVAGTRPGRTSADEIFVFDGTGTALQDVAAAQLLVDEARRRGVGLEIALDR
jgi:alanine dehydrogenase